MEVHTYLGRYNVRMAYKAQKGNDWHRIRFGIRARIIASLLDWRAKQKRQYIKGVSGSFAWLDTGVLGIGESPLGRSHLILFYAHLRALGFLYMAPTVI